MKRLANGDKATFFFPKQNKYLAVRWSFLLHLLSGVIQLLNELEEFYQKLISCDMINAPSLWNLLGKHDKYSFYWAPVLSVFLMHFYLSWHTWITVFRVSFFMPHDHHLQANSLCMTLALTFWIFFHENRIALQFYQCGISGPRPYSPSQMLSHLLVIESSFLPVLLNSLSFSANSLFLCYTASTGATS